MGSIPDIYWHEIRGRFERLPVWLPGTPFALGDVGHLSPSRWTKKTTLPELGITVKPDEEGAPTDYDYSSAQGVNVETQLSGQVNTLIPGLQAGEAGFLVTFSRSGACVFKAAQVRVKRIGNLHDVEQTILHLYVIGKWQRDWTYVTEVVRGGPACVLVAEHASANAVVNLGFDMPAGTASLAAAKDGLRLGRSKDLAAGFVTPDVTTVLWSGRYIRDPLFRTPRGDDRGESIAGDMKTSGELRTAPIEFLADNLPADES